MDGVLRGRWGGGFSGRVLYAGRAGEYGGWGLGFYAVGVCFGLGRGVCLVVLVMSCNGAWLVWTGGGCACAGFCFVAWLCCLEFGLVGGMIEVLLWRLRIVLGYCTYLPCCLVSRQILGWFGVPRVGYIPVPAV